MNPIGKYRPFKAVPIKSRRWPDNAITKAPIWCSVDLRDGNQALVNPMGIGQKLEFFDMLVKIGFKEIEVGFPSSSDTEFNFLRRLIEEGHVPADVTLQVLCQAREHLIRRTFEALKGAPRAIFHIYNSTSPAQRKYTFNKTREEITAVAVDGVRCVKNCLGMSEGTEIRLEYSPESFSTTEIDYALEICEAVKAEWGATAENKIILNLPTTVECAMPNQFADQIEYFCTHITGRKNVIISLHNHNDRGEGVAQCELGLLAGADRVEGTLFGNGERTGNLDIVNVALNMYTQGINPNLDFSDIGGISAAYERLTGMQIDPRLPYAGELVFTAFSGSHQDAIRKGMAARTKMLSDDFWDVPYLPIDPHDIGRQYEGIIRINSQSGKGGAAFILEHDYAMMLPKAMHPAFGALVKKAADTAQHELKPSEIYDVFSANWLRKKTPLSLIDIGGINTLQNAADKSGNPDGGLEEAERNLLICATVEWEGKKYEVRGRGNGPLDAFRDALGLTPAPRFTVTSFYEHSAESGADATAVAYVQLTLEDGRQPWGVGKSSDVAYAGIAAIVSALNFTE